MQNNKKSSSIPELKNMLLNMGVEKVVSHLVGAGNYQKSGNTLSMSSYQGGSQGGSFTVTTTGPHAGIWHENNLDESPDSVGRGDLIELWSLVNRISKGDAIQEIKIYVGDISGQEPKVSNVRPKMALVQTKKLSKSKPASDSSIARYQGKLGSTPEALAYLHGRGLNDKTIEHFKIGVSFPGNRTATIDRKKVQVPTDNALVFPIMTPAGFMSPYAYYEIPDFTLNAVAGAWCGCGPRITYNTIPTNKHQFLFITEGMKDLWMLHQVIQGTDLQDTLLIASSTHGSVVPSEVKDNPTIFNNYEKVFLGHDSDDAGEKIWQLWASYVGLKSHRVRPPFENKSKDKDWTDFFGPGVNNIKQLSQLLSSSVNVNPVKLAKPVTRLSECIMGSIMPPADLDVTSAFHNGFMYYSVKVMQAVEDVYGEITVAHTIKVIRSDKKMLDVHELKAGARFSLLDTQMYRLSDDTIIKRAPQVSVGASWDITHATAWLDGKFTPRPIEKIVCDMVTIMESRIWLPNKDDYTVLALTMVTTYVQQIFDAVPFLLVTGVAGSGKTELGRILKELGCNAVVTGDISAATITRLIDSTKGLLIIDDAEKLSKKGGAGNSQVDDLLQILKVSYKKSSATRQVTDNKTMQVQELDFYGVKLFTNTTGMEDILGTRTIPINTRKPMGDFKQAEMPYEKLRELRAEMHAWAMENATQVDTVYRQFSVSNRDDEITTPFRVFAEMAKRNDWSDLVDRLVSRLAMERQTNNQDTEEGYLREAVLNIARRGYISITMEHVLLEMELLVPENFGKSFTTEIPEWKHTSWVKRNLNAMGFLTSSSGKRVRVHGKKEVPLQRLYSLSKSLFQEIKKASDDVYIAITHLEPVDGKDYCRQHVRCMDCHYENLSCEIKVKTGKR
jgi:hypothetical protein